ncbi:restriction endonuclease subunit S [Flavobacterium chungnamense]|uniref:Restriction endonuclease subunit S n=1 Tax=Flavobacterium chungnamense TaxID=706182 RepID=A0ABP7V200_9FLAO
MSEWKEYKIEDFCEVIGGGTPSTKEDSYYGGEISWITPRDLTNHKNRFISRGERNITELGLKNSSARILPKNSILLTSRAPIGYLAIAENEVCTNQGFKSLIVNPEKADYNFIYYLIKSNIERIKTLGTGTTFAEISGSVVKKLKFSIPELPTQTAIAEILSSLDDKIELNNKINQELETLAQTLFKQWFIDFDFPNENGEPYKSSGGEMVDSELGEIPKGWKVERLVNFIKFIKGKKPPEVFDREIENTLPQILIETLDSGKSMYARPEKMVICEKDDIIIVMDGASSGRIEIGFNGILGSTLAIIKSNGINNNLLYQFLKYKEQDIRNNTTGAAIPHTDKSKIFEYLISLPIENIVSDFSSIQENILKMIFTNKSELKYLINLRDTLLPKLISGELEINEINN